MDAITKRIHIGGLTSDFSAVALKEKLGQYGEVISLEGCSDDFMNAVGTRRPYAFATMRATPAQFSKCMNTLSGAVWKGAKLRVGEAKPKVTERIQSRLAKESELTRLSQERAVERHARWLRKRPWLAIESEDLRPVTPQQVKNGEWGWKITPAGHLIRPIHMRPERPLSKPSDHTPSRKRSVPSRQQRVTIDPTRYKREHLTELFLDGSLTDSVKEVSWRCQENQDGSQQWLAVDKRGNVLCTEAVAQKRLAQRLDDETRAVAEQTSHDDDMWSLQVESELPSFQTEVPDSLFDNSDSASHPQLSASWWNEEDNSELREERAMGSKTEPISNSYDSSEHTGEYIDANNSLFDRNTKPAASGWWEEQSELANPVPQLTEEPGRIRTPRRPAPAFDESDFSDGYEEVLSEPKPTSTSDERSNHLALLDKLLPDAEPGLHSPTSSPISEVATTTEAGPQVLDDERLKGQPDSATRLSQDGKSSDSIRHEDSQAQKTGQNSDDVINSNTSIIHLNGADTDTSQGTAAHNPVALLSESRKAPESSSLKDMFQENGTFSLFDTIADEDLFELELEDSSNEIGPVEAPMTTPVPPKNPIKFSALTTRTSIGHNSLLEELQRNGSQPFWCVSSDDQIEDRWKEQRAEITQSFKRMHREAVKKTRRRVAGARAGSGTTRVGVAPAIPP